MMVKTPNRPKLFTVEQANATLPLVRVITADIMNLAKDVIDRRQRLEHLTAGRPSDAGDLYSDELLQIAEELSKDTKRLQEYAAELQQLGVELKSAADGLVDFPARLDDRDVYLCWKYGEPEVLHWHLRDAGFSGRQPLTADTACGDTSADMSGETTT